MLDLGQMFYLGGETLEDTNSWRNELLLYSQQKVSKLEKTMPTLEDEPKPPTTQTQEFQMEEEPVEKIKKSGAPKKVVLEIPSENIPISAEPTDRKLEIPNIQISSSSPKKDLSLKRESPRKESSPLRKKAKNLIQKSKSKIYSDYQVEDFLSSVKQEEGLVKEISSQKPEGWSFSTEKDGLKFLERQYFGQSYDLFQKITLYNIHWGAVFLSGLFLLILSIGLFLKIALFGFIIGAGYIHKLKHFNKLIKLELLGRIIFEEDAIRVFDSIKKVGYRKNWDLSVKDLKKEQTSDKSKKIFDVEHAFPKLGWPYDDNILSGVKCKVDRTHFILNQDTMIVIEYSQLHRDFSTKHQEPTFRMKEVYVIQRYNKLSGKCVVTVYNQIETNLMQTYQLVK